MVTGRRGAPEPAHLRDALTPEAQDLTQALDGAPIPALSTWDWLTFEEFTPVMRSWFGDVFFLAHDGIWLLDVIEGSFERLWAGALDLAVALADHEGQDRYLLGGLVLGARNAGLVPAPSESYTFTPPPVLGGTIDLDHLGILDTEAHLSIAGQVFSRLRNLPPGATVTDLELA